MVGGGTGHLASGNVYGQVQSPSPRWNLGFINFIWNKSTKIVFGSSMFFPIILINLFFHLQIPFTKFVLTNAGYLQDHQMDFPRIRTVGFTLADHNTGPFHLEIDYIKMVMFMYKPKHFQYHYNRDFWCTAYLNNNSNIASLLKTILMSLVEKFCYCTYLNNFWIRMPNSLTYDSFILWSLSLCRPYHISNQHRAGTKISSCQV